VGSRLGLGSLQKPGRFPVHSPLLARLFARAVVAAQAVDAGDHGVDDSEEWGVFD